MRGGTTTVWGGSTAAVSSQATRGVESGSTPRPGPGHTGRHIDCAGTGPARNAVPLVRGHPTLVTLSWWAQTPPTRPGESIPARSPPVEGVFNCVVIVLVHIAAEG